MVDYRLEVLFKRGQWNMLVISRETRIVCAEEDGLFVSEAMGLEGEEYHKSDRGSLSRREEFREHLHGVGCVVAATFVRQVRDWYGHMGTYANPRLITSKRRM